MTFERGEERDQTLTPFPRAPQLAYLGMAFSDARLAEGGAADGGERVGVGYQIVVFLWNMGGGRVREEARGNSRRGEIKHMREGVRGERSEGREDGAGSAQQEGRDEMPNRGKVRTRRGESTFKEEETPQHRRAGLLSFSSHASPPPESRAQSPHPHIELGDNRRRGRRGGEEEGRVLHPRPRSKHPWIRPAKRNPPRVAKLVLSSGVGVEGGEICESLAGGEPLQWGSVGERVGAGGGVVAAIVSVFDCKENCASVGEPLDGVVAVGGGGEDRAIERRALSSHAEEDGSSWLVEGGVDKIGLIPRRVVC